MWPFRARPDIVRQEARAALAAPRLAEAPPRVAVVPEVPDLLAALQSEEAARRKAATDAVIREGARWTGPEAIALAAGVAAAARDVNPGVRVSALRALRELGPAAKVGLPALLGALKGPPGEEREAAAAALGRVGVHEAVPALIAALRQGEASAARSLGQLHAVEAVPDLIAALRDPAVGGVAAEALGALGDARALPALEEFIATWRPPAGPDGDPDDREFARAAIEQIRGGR